VFGSDGDSLEACFERGRPPVSYTSASSLRS
jgi:hypothetical protein